MNKNANHGLTNYPDAKCTMRGRKAAKREGRREEQRERGGGKRMA